MSFGAAAAALGIALFLLLSERTHWRPYLSWLAAWSMTAMVFYGWDKAQAQRGGWRVPELILHALALIGGVAGCWAGMLFFRHKTKKVEFRLLLVFATIVHGAIALSLLH